MIAKGRTISARHRSRNYYELCMVASYPTYTEDSKQLLTQHYYDSSLSPAEWAARERIRQKAEAKAAEHYRPSTAALDFFKTQTRGLNVER